MNTSLGEIQPNGSNPRRIERRALEKLCKSITRDPVFMTLRPIVVDDNNIVIGGNQRLRACIELGMTELPDGWVVSAGKLTKRQRDRFIMIDNSPQGMSGEWDFEALKRDFDVSDISDCGLDLPDKKQNDWIKDLDKTDVLVEKSDEEKEEDSTIFALRTDVRFPSTNKFGIPDLKKEMIYDGLPPTATWNGAVPVNTERPMFLMGSNKIPDDYRGGFLAFYVDDHRFESIWTNAVDTLAKYQAFEFNAIIAPDFSIFGDDPLAVQLWHTYRSRWVARYWQEAGIKVIPSINSCCQCDDAITTMGLDQGTPLVACQVRSSGKAEGKAWTYKQLTNALNLLKPQACMVYGAEHKDDLGPLLPKGIEYFWYESFMSCRNKLRKSQGKI